jgi:hypothetical protein
MLQTVYKDQRSGIIMQSNGSSNAINFANGLRESANTSEAHRTLFFEYVNKQFEAKATVSICGWFKQTGKLCEYTWRYHEKGRVPSVGENFVVYRDLPCFNLQSKQNPFICQCYKVVKSETNFLGVTTTIGEIVSVFWMKFDDEKQEYTLHDPEKEVYKKTFYHRIWDLIYSIRGK